MSDTFPTAVHAEKPSAYKAPAQAHIASIDELKKKAKMYKEQLDYKLLEDEDYADLDKEITELKDKKAKIKEAILSRPELQPLLSEIRDVKEELKDTQLTLSEYLFGYMKDTGANQITDLEGQKRKITKKAAVK